MAKTNNNTATKTFQFKLHPNKAFVAACEKTLDECRFLWNCSLEQRISHFRQTLALTGQGESLNFYEQSRQLTETRTDIPELKSCLRSIQSDVLKRLDFAFDAFFRRLKEGSGKAGFPVSRAKTGTILSAKVLRHNAAARSTATS